MTNIKQITSDKYQIPNGSLLTIPVCVNIVVASIKEEQHAIFEISKSKHIKENSAAGGSEY